MKGIDLSSYESIEHYLSARFFQLTVAIKLDLWQDAFKSIEDIYYLISTSKDVIIPAEQLLNYYEQLTKIFWNSKHYILHAYAQYKAFGINRIIADPAKLQESATNLLLSTLTTPSNDQPETVPTDFVSVRNERRLVTLLGLSAPPSKQLLVSELAAKNVTQLIYPELKDLYKIFEVDFNPLKMCERMKPILEFVKSREDLAVYYEPLKQMTVTKLLEQLSKAFQTIKIETVAKLADFVSLIQLEKILVHNASLGKIQASIDHGKGVLIFGKSPKSFDASDIQKQISAFGKRIHDVVDLIHPERKKEKEERRKKLISEISKKISPEIEQISFRNDFIRMKKLWYEQEQKRALEKAEERKIELVRLAELEEERLAQLEAKNREEEKKRREKKLAEEKRKKEIIDQITNNNVKAQQDLLKIANKSLKKKITSLLELDIDDIIELKRGEIQREKKEKEKKLFEKAKALDYLEITRREIELPLFDEYNKKQQALNKEAFENYLNKQNQDLQKELTEMKQKKQEFSKYFADQKTFLDKFVLKARREEYEKLKQEQDERKRVKKEQWEAKRKALLEERERKRKEEEEKRKREEEEREKKRKEEEEQRKKREEERERERKKREEQEEIQRKKEEEYYRKQKEKEMELDKKLKEQQPQTPQPTKGRWDNLDTETSSPFGKSDKRGGFGSGGFGGFGGGGRGGRGGFGGSSRGGDSGRDSGRDGGRGSSSGGDDAFSAFSSSKGGRGGRGGSRQ